MSDLPHGWRPLSAGDAPPTERAPHRLLPADAARPVLWVPVLGALLVAGFAQGTAGWSAAGVNLSALPADPATLLAAERLGVLSAGRFAPLDALASLVLQPRTLLVWFSLLGLVVVAPLLEALRGRAVWLEAWILSLGLAQGAQQLDPFTTPGDACTLLPLCVGASIAALVNLPEARHANTSIRVLGAVVIAWGGLVLLTSISTRPGLHAAAFAAGGVLGALPRVGPRAGWVLGIAGAALWIAGAAVVAERADGQRPPLPDFCADDPAPPGPPISPRHMLLEVLGAIQGQCHGTAVARGEALEAAWPAIADSSSWNNDFAWALALARPEDPGTLADAEERVRSSFAARPTVATRHTLATVLVLQGELAEAGPHVHELLAEDEGPANLALRCLLEISRDDRAAASRRCAELLGHPERERSQMVPLVIDRLTAAGHPLPPQDDEPPD